MVSRHHQEMEQQHKKNEKEELLHLRKIASLMAKEVKHFWESIHKVHDIVYTAIHCISFLSDCRT